MNDHAHSPFSGAPAAAPLYASHRKIHPKAVKGRFRRLKWWLTAVFLVLYLVLPWVRWDRGAGMPDQAVLFDLEAQRFYLFGAELWPQQVYIMTGIMILAAVGLFLATAIAGRVWCGFACPQTVWTDLFVWAEAWIEGDRGARIRLDKGPRDSAYLTKKAAKHAVWLAISAVTGITALLYFTDAPGFIADAAAFAASPLVLGWMAFMTISTYLMAGFMREQMCLYVCPWPRIQAAMLDDDSLVVTYQGWRGEGRAPLRKDQTHAERQAMGLGDCIDCGACVHVCPTGIDIRDGLQMDCISCGLCADACDDVMTRIGQPLGLIRFDTQAAQAVKAERRAETPAVPTRIIRPRTIVYTLLLIIATAATVMGLVLRPTAGVSVLRDRAPLFVTLSDGRIQNSYTVKLSNMTPQPQSFRLSVTGVPGAAVTVAGGTEDAVPTLTAGPDRVETARIHVRAAAGLPASTPLTVTLTDAATGTVHSSGTVFLSP